MQNDNSKSRGDTTDQGPGLHPAATKADGLNSKGAGEVHHFLADIEDLVAATGSLTGDELARAKAKLTERIAAARTTVEETATAISTRARAGATATDRYVHDQPWKAMGIGAVVGLILGVVLARRG